MTLQQFCLRWNNHQPNFISVFATLLNSESLVDVTLAAEGRHLQAHRVVLSACSSYFQSLFTVNPCQHPIVILKDVKFDDLKTMVDFMYYGEVNVSQEQLPAILKTAEMLKIKGLAEMPERHNSTSALHASKSSSISFDKADFMTSIDSTGGLDIRHTPSPSSPSTRRKRLRKSSTGSGSGSTERNSEETVNEITIIPTNSLGKAEPITPVKADVRSFSRSRTGTQEASTDSETRDGSQESVDDDRMHVERSPADSPGDVVAAASLSDAAWPSTSRQSDSSPVSKIGKRGRLLMRQPRVKKETDPQQTSPDSEPGSPRLAAAQVRIDTDPGSPRPKPVRLDSEIGSQRLTPIPLRLESETGCPRLAPKPARNESEPGSPRSASVRFDGGDGCASRLAPYPVRIDSPESSRLVSVPPRIEEGGTTRMQVPPVRLERQGSECRVSPPRSTALHLLSVPQPSYLVKQHSHPLLPSQKQRGAGGSSVHRQLSTPTPTSQPLQVHFCPSLPYKDGDAGDVPMSRSASEHAEPVRAPRPASGELRRASSSPQASTPREGFEMRSVHCPMLRPGPALGCNFCWNTVDAHGRILRRKTKYHCPECQTNLCIVPCFQEYHERNAAGVGGATSPNGGRPALPKNSSI